MSQDFAPIRVLFAIISIAAFAICFVTLWQPTAYSLILGIATGAAAAALFALFEKMLAKISLYTGFVVCLGLGWGYLLSQALLTMVTATWVFADSDITQPVIHLAIHLASAYIGLVIASKVCLQLQSWAARLAPAGNSAAYSNTKKEALMPTSAVSKQERLILADVSALADPRIIDLAASGILDGCLVISNALIAELYHQAENEDESQKIKARKALDAIKKLETFTSLQIHYNDSNIAKPAYDNPTYSTVVAMAKQLHASILTADISRLQQAAVDGVRIINLNDLSNALKPLMQAGEVISIKVQRYGKEPRQGVGYLEDGTMVVVNGGASYIGEMVQAHVLSVKHSSTGARMIFCNAIEDELHSPSNLLEEPPPFPSMIKRSMASSNNFCTL